MPKNGGFNLFKPKSTRTSFEPKTNDIHNKEKKKRFWKPSRCYDDNSNAETYYDEYKTSMKDETTVFQEAQPPYDSKRNSSRGSRKKKSWSSKHNTTKDVNIYMSSATKNNYFEKLSTQSKTFFNTRKASLEKKSHPRFVLDCSKKSILRFIHKEKEMDVAQLRDLKNEVDIDEHLIPLEELYSILDTHPDRGLSELEVKRRLEKDGPNSLPQKYRINNVYVLVGYIFRGFSALLWFGALLSFLAYLLEAETNEEKPQDNLWLGIILALTCILTGMFSFYQERKSSHITESFAKMIPTRATVIRNGSVKEIDSAGLVRGDIVLLKIGDKVPADIRLIEIQDLKAENSSLTGEVEPVTCTLGATNSFAVESRNLVFFSTNLVSGSGKGVVILTGSNTVMGKIAGLTNRLEKKTTPIEQEVQHFMRLISMWALTLGAICFLLALYIGYNWLNACVYVIGIIVANVPEGLLATLTVSLTLTAKRLASKNCIVRRLQTVETLGSIRTICTDKTGTLTQNKMTVLHLSFNREIYHVKNGVDVDIQNFETNTTYKTLVRAACLCSKAEFEPNQDNIPMRERKASGDATEVGILHFIQPRIKSIQDVRNTFPKVTEVPFNSLNKFHLTVHFSPLNKYFLLMKGAPEVIMERCTTMMAESDKEAFLTAEKKYELEDKIKLFASKGERVLAFADLHLGQNNFPVNFKFSTDPMNFPSSGFRLIGLISLYDPPRPAVPDAIDACHKAGIRVIMVTGDHPCTAKAIAIKCHILSETSSDDNVFTGTELRKITDEELKDILETNKELVFARTSPLQKLRIVELYQSLDEIVAVTGDGVNDAPALKKADIGIAMGITGSEVSKQTADMILMDDNFASIVLGIEEGRLIFDNLKKSIAYILASNIPEILPFLFYIFLGIPLPVSTVTVLCIDLGTDMWPAVSLAYEKPESNIMSREPRNPRTDHLVGRKLVTYAYFHLGILETLAGFLTYFHVMYDAGWDPMDLLNIRKSWESNNNLEDSYHKVWTRTERMNLESTCQTAYFISIVIAQCAALIVCKTRYNSIYQQKMNNWVLNIGLVFEILVAFVVSYSPYLNKVLKTRPVKMKYWLTPLPIAVLIVIYGEFGKIISRLYPNSFMAHHLTF
ncbi:hypothetical protein M8J76_013952 [Diaphorina citri]|nr:hypothetical protein M8J76_013952 [Diaphorina citri]